MINKTEIIIKKGLKPVENFSLDRYLGEWFEIGRTENWFEKGQINVKAFYEKDGEKVKIHNSGYLNGELKEIIGEAKFKYSKNVGWFDVTFFKPYSDDYKIVYLDENYENAIVTGDDDKSLWILSRNNLISMSTLERLLLIVKKNGFDLEEIKFTQNK